MLRTLDPDEWCRRYSQTSCRARHLKDMHEISFCNLMDGNRDNDKVAARLHQRHWSMLGCNIAIVEVADLYNGDNLTD